ncbi:TPA: restriction endonuclease subunit S [Escherichia coli]
MSELNYLEKLLDGTEVEWKALGDVTSVLRGKRLTKNLLSAEEKFPVFHGGLEPLGYYNKSNRPANTVMIINVGASAGTVGYSTVDFWSSDGCFCLEHNELLNNRFLYFALIGYQSLLKSKVRVAGIPTLDAIVVNKLLIPIPCPENPEKSLAIQSKIVRILDRFSALTAELTAELNMRKKQYNYYRDQLLSFDEEQEKPIYLEKLLDGVEVEWKPLEDISIKISSGGTPKTGVSEFYDGDIPWLRTQEVNFCDIWDTEVKITESGVKNSSAKWIPKNCVIVAMYGATVGKIGINKIPMTTNQACANIQLNEEVAHYRYVFHFLCSQYTYIKSLGTGSQTNINAQIVKNIKIPIPCPDNPKKSLAIQSEIVRILDKFDTLTNSITEGLPREIELRQKQYEYYRDLLFSFPKPETVSN